MNRIRQRAHEILQIPSAAGDRLGHTFDAFIIALIVLNVTAVVVGTIPSVDAAYGGALHTFELFSIGVFVVEYVLRVWAVTASPAYAHPVKGRLRFMATPMALIDMLAVLPALVFFVDLRILRVLRLARILKLTRYSTAWQTLTRVVRDRSDALLASFVVIGLALLVSSSLMYYAENAAQPGAFDSIPDAMWWGIAALTTTGYGDVVPITMMGRFLGAMTAVLGIAVVALPSAILAAGYMEALQERRAAAQRPQVCRHCGEHMDAPLAPAGMRGPR